MVPAEHGAGAGADDPGPSLTSHAASGERTAWEGVQPQFSIFTRPEALSGARSPEG